MRHSIFSILVALSLFISTGTRGAARGDQAPAVPAPIVESTIELKNLAPDVMAWLLDPTRHQTPTLLTPLFLATKSGRPERVNSGDYTVECLWMADNLLPDNLESIAPVDQQSALLVRGTAAGIQETQDLMTVLDRPIRAVDFEAQYIEINDGDLNSLLPEAKLKASEFRNLLCVLSPGSIIALDDFISTKKARIISLQKFVTINSMSTKATLEKSLDFWIEGDHKSPDNPSSARALRFSVSPTIGSDGTVSLHVVPPTFEPLEPITKGNLMESKLTDGGISNVPDGSTVAFLNLGGVRKRLPSDRSRILFLTPRLVRLTADAHGKTVILSLQQLGSLN